MEQTTKERIVSQALLLFSEKGFEAVSVSEIAAAVGIKAPSLYKHFASKREIFEAILRELNLRYERQAAAMQMNGTKAAEDQQLFNSLSEDGLIERGRGLFLYFLHDEFASRCRRMLTIERYRSRELSALYAQMYFDEPIAYQSQLLGFLTGTGLLTGEDPQMMALHFYGPMYTLLTLCDGQPERETEALELMERHIRQFGRLYGRKD